MDNLVVFYAGWSYKSIVNTLTKLATEGTYFKYIYLIHDGTVESSKTIAEAKSAIEEDKSLHPSGELYIETIEIDVPNDDYDRFYSVIRNVLQMIINRHKDLNTHVCITGVRKSIVIMLHFAAQVLRIPNIWNIESEGFINSDEFQPDKVRLVRLPLYFRSSPTSEEKGSERFHNFVFRSEKTRKICELAEIYAKTDIPILLVGEPGSGKDELAQAIHVESGRKGKFIDIHCGTVPNHLLIDELFGHVKGAFTGANSDRKGKFLDAAGGTVFLNQIESIPVSEQITLLKAIEKRRFTMLGSNKELQIDFRLICATNVDPDTLLQQHKTSNESGWRTDFFERISQLIIKIPSLRDRSDDIPVLIEHFLTDLKKTNRVSDDLLFAPETSDFIAKLPSITSVRVLRQLVERISVAADAESIAVITPAFLVEKLADQSETANLPIPTLPQLEQQYLEIVMKSVKNQNKAAKFLGISPRKLRRILRGK